MPRLGKGIGIDLVQLGSGLKPPAYSLATLWLDGSIIDVSGSKYFVDKKAGNNVLITNYDFPSNWQKGFPLKSAATIDIFGLTGVPVISLFQNFDYGDQFFTKHVAQVIDSNGIETSEAYVSEIVAYSAPLTGANLTAANSYFGVPERESGALWVSKTGSNSNVGTEALPMLTIDYASNSTANQKTIYVKSGAYSEDTSGANYIYLTTLKKIVPIGLVNVTASGSSTNNALRQALQISEAGFNLASKATVLYVYYNTNKSGCKLTRLKLTGVSGNQYGFALGSALTLTVDNAIITGAFADSIFFASNFPLTLKNSFVNALARWPFDDSGAGTMNITNNRFLLNALTASPVYLQRGSARAQNVYYKGNNINITNCPATFAMFDIQVNIAAIEFIGQKINISAISKSVLSIVYITVNEAAKINSNIILNSATANTAHIFVKAIGTSSEITEAKNNYIKSLATATGLGIGIGEDTFRTVAGAGLVEGNRIIGKLTSDRSASINFHAVLFGFVPGNIKYNYISGAGYGIVNKNDNAASGNIFYNVIEDCIVGILNKGSNDSVIVHNTVIVKNAIAATNYTGLSIQRNQDSGGTAIESKNCTVKNNIIIMEVAGYCANVAQNVAFPQIIDYNIYYSTAAKPFVYNGVEKTFLEWQALGFDTHSVMITDLAQANALFTDYDNGNYTLASGSEAIGAGVEVVGYTTGMDSASNFGSDSTTPVIVTKENTSLCVGAFVS